MGIEQGLFLSLFVYPAHSLTPEVFSRRFVFVLENLCVCAARRCAFVPFVRTAPIVSAQCSWLLASVLKQPTGFG